MFAVLIREQLMLDAVPEGMVGVIRSTLKVHPWTSAEAVLPVREGRHEYPDCSVTSFDCRQRDRRQWVEGV
ncbi:hypothetical protein [Caballeronia calidae]|nr:hypothetical protein [Caballeronia calidae]